MAAVDKSGNLITGKLFQNPLKSQVGDGIDETVVNDLINPLQEKKRMLDAADKMAQKPSGILEKNRSKLLTDDGREIINEG
jgi:hypothetical protein